MARRTYHIIVKDTYRARALKIAKEQRTKYGVRARAVKNDKGSYDVEISVK